jgi:hypothetical protein
MPDGVRYEGIFGTTAADMAQAAGGAPRAQMLAAAPVGAAGKVAAVQPPAPVTSSEGTRRELRDRARPASERESDSALLAEPAPVQPTVRVAAAVRVKLAPALLVLVEQGPAAPGAARADGGWVRVRIVLATRDAAAQHALQTAGLQREADTADGVVGLVRVDQLTALAALAEVRSVVAAPAQ